MFTFRRIGRYGRFGNQMFQYATLLAVAKSRGVPFGVAFGNTSENDYQHFCLPDVFPNLSACDCTAAGPATVEFREAAWDHFHPEVSDLPDGADLAGFFQNERYFLAFRDDLLREFRTAPALADAAAGFLTDLRDRAGRPVVSVHVRRGDYIGSSRHPVLDRTYYRRAFTAFPGCVFAVFSDDPAWCRANLATEGVYPIDLGNSFVEFEAARQCDHFVVANSSFSWWAAWLGAGPGAVVVAPRVWVGEHVARPPARLPIHADGWISL